MDYFALLGLAPAFDLDPSALESAYFKAQRLYHPDRFVGKPDAQRLNATQRSVDINQAYQTLKEPLPRAQYLLHLQGIEVGTDADTVKPSQALLTEVMELHEMREEGRMPDLHPVVLQSIAIISKHYKNSSFDDMAQETLRLGYLVKATT